MVSPSMLHDMPEELLALVISHCPLSSLPCAAAACRRFAACAAPDQPVWRSHILRRLGAGEETERWPVSGDADSRAHATPSWRDLLLAHHSEAAALSAVAALDTSDIASFLKFRAAQVANCWREELPPPAQLLKGASVQQLHISGGTISFTGRLGRDRAVRAESPVPLSSKYVSLRAGGGGEAKIALSGIYYFEVSISDAPLPGDDAFTADRPPCVSIGLATEHFRLQDKQAGWTSDSLGWHGDDGVLYHRSGRGLQRFGPPFGAGDTIGCGVHLASRRVFFTLNGSLVGTAFEITSRGAVVYPAVGIDSHQELRFNFGSRSPFEFDLSVAAAAEAELREAAARGDARELWPAFVPAVLSASAMFGVVLDLGDEDDEDEEGEEEESDDEEDEEEGEGAEEGEGEGEEEEEF